MTTVRLPLFPLNSVLYPGLVLPLNIFEERYRAMMRELLKTPEDQPRRFAVVAIRDGHEVAPSAPGMPDPTALPDRGPTAGFGEQPTKAFFKGFSNVSYVAHDGGHQYPMADVARFLDASLGDRDAT